MSDTRLPLRKRATRRLPGFRWRTLAWNEDTGEKHEQRFDPSDDVCFDELVIDDWFHLEQMNTRHYWLGLGKGADMLHVRIQIPAKGQIRVGIEDDGGDEPIVTYFHARTREPR